MNRALGGGERQWWVQSQRAACNIALATCIDAPVDRARFTAATHWLQRRYPLLAAKVAVVDGEPRFVAGAPPVSVRWEARSGPDAWRPVAAREVCAGFPAEGPLVRFVVHASAEATDLLLCASHIIIDGLSLAQITTDVLRFMHDPSLSPEPVKDQGTLDERAPRSYRRRWWPFARHLASQILAAPHDPARHARLREHYRGRDRVDFVTLALEPAETERLRLESRAHGTTVQGAVTAAMALAVGEREARFGRRKISVHSPINLRNLLEPPVKDEIGNFAAGTTTWVPRDGAFWDIAKSVKADIEHAIARGAPFAHERLAKGAKRLAPRTRPRWIALRLWPDLGVTNLGRVTVPSTPEGQRVREMHVLLALPVMQTFVCSTVTVGGRLFCDFHYCPDDVPREEVMPMVEAAARRLRSLPM